MPVVSFRLICNTAEGGYLRWGAPRLTTFLAICDADRGWTAQVNTTYRILRTALRIGDQRQVFQYCQLDHLYRRMFPPHEAQHGHLPFAPCEPLVDYLDQSVKQHRV